MLFDPDESDVSTFINHLKFMERLEGDAAVLRVWPLCLKGRALEWHSVLPTDTQLDLMESIDACYEAMFHVIS